MIIHQRAIDAVGIGDQCDLGPGQVNAWTRVDFGSIDYSYYRRASYSQRLLSRISLVGRTVPENEVLCSSGAHHS